MYFGREFAVPTIALIVLGFALMCWRAPAVAVLVALGLALEWSFAFTYRIGDYYVFYITGYLLMAVTAGYAVGVVVRWLASHAGRGALVVRVRDAGVTARGVRMAYAPPPLARRRGEPRAVPQCTRVSCRDRNGRRIHHYHAHRGDAAC